MRLEQCFDRFSITSGSDFLDSFLHSFHTEISNNLTTGRKVVFGFIKELAEQHREPSVKVSQIIEFVTHHDPEKGRLVEKRLAEFRFRFVLNQFRRSTDPTLGAKFERLCNRHFYSTFQFLGNLSYDDRIHDSISSKNIYVHKYPYTVTAMELQKISKEMTNATEHAVSLSSKAR